jgi:hypothetical protein
VPRGSPESFVRDKRGMLRCLTSERGARDDI